MSRQRGSSLVPPVISFDLSRLCFKRKPKKIQMIHSAGPDTIWVSYNLNKGVKQMLNLRRGHTSYDSLFRCSSLPERRTVDFVPVATIRCTWHTDTKPTKHALMQSRLQFQHPASYFTKSNVVKVLDTSTTWTEILFCVVQENQSSVKIMLCNFEFL